MARAPFLQGAIARSPYLNANEAQSSEALEIRNAEMQKFGS